MALSSDAAFGALEAWHKEKGAKLVLRDLFAADPARFDKFR